MSIGGIGQSWFIEAERGTPKSCHTIDIGFAVDVEDTDAFAAIEDHRAYGFVQPEVRGRVQVIGNVAAGGGVVNLRMRHRYVLAIAARSNGSGEWASQYR